MGVGEQLDLDVPGLLDVALAEDGVVAERGLRLAAGGLERGVELGVRAHDPHPSPAAPGRRLDEQREADLLRVPVSTAGTPASRAIRLASSLSPPARSAAGGGPIQIEPGRLGRRRRARRSRPGSRTRGGSRPRRSPARRGRAPRSRGSSRSRRSRPALRACRAPASSGSRDRDRRDPELAAGAEHAHRDLAAVRDQQLANVAAHMRKIPNRVSGIGASSAAEIPSASTRRVSSGSMIPSSQRRAVE